MKKESEQFEITMAPDWGKMGIDEKILNQTGMTSRELAEYYNRLLKMWLNFNKQNNADKKAVQAHCNKLFCDFLNYVIFVKRLESAKHGTKIWVEGVEREAIFMASYQLDFYQSAEYLKVFFNDGTILEVYDEVPFYENESSLYFYEAKSKELDKKLFKEYDEILRLNGEDFLLTVNSAKQYIQKIFFGKLENSETKNIISIYSGSHGFWLVEEGKTMLGRYAKRISIKDVAFGG